MSNAAGSNAVARKAARPQQPDAARAAQTDGPVRPDAPLPDAGLTSLLLKDLSALLREPMHQQDAEWAKAIVDKLLQLTTPQPPEQSQTAETADASAGRTPNATQAELADELQHLRERLVRLRQQIEWKTSPLHPQVDDELKASLLTSVKRVVQLLGKAARRESLG